MTVQRTTSTAALVLALVWSSSVVHAAPGDIDLTFNAGVITSQFLQDTLPALAVQPDGKVLIGGIFNVVAGLPRHSLARLNADGSVDTAFVPPAFLQSDLVSPRRIAVQPDGKIVVAGRNFRIGGTLYQLIRLNANGSLDASFSLVPIDAFRGIEGLALQTDGRILIGGDFSSVDGVERRIVARLNANGTLDSSFAIGLLSTAHGGRAEAFAIQPDGKIVAGGALFVTVGGTTFANLVRLNANGTPDTSFQVAGDALDGVHAVVLQADGQLLAAGDSSGNAGSRRSLIRLNPNGSVDASFISTVPLGAQVYDLALEPGGKVIAVGNYCTSPFGQGCGIARFNPDGSRDPFYPVTAGCGNNGPTDTVYAVVRQPDGNVLISGSFQTLSCLPRQRVARLLAGDPLLPPPTTVADSYATAHATPLAVAAPGVLANDVGSALIAQLATGTANGVVSLAATGAFTYTPNAGFTGADSFTYRATNVNGPGNVATVTLTVAAPPTTVQPPTGLRVSLLAGNVVTLRWTPSAVGPAPTDYVVEGGVLPGQVLGTLPIGGPLPILTFSAPTAALFLRVHALAGSQRSGPSNEIRVFVNVPAVPSAPAALTGVTNGGTLGLSWRTTFEGGAPTALQLSVSGPVVGTLPLPVSETFAFAGVPPGTYTFRVRAVNGTGSSGDSNPVTLTFPNGCTGAPSPPAEFLAYRIGNVVHLVWDPPAGGPAVASYAVKVGGSYTGTFPMAARSFQSPAPSGSYTFNVVATNACGASPATPTLTVFVP